MSGLYIYGQPEQDPGLKLLTTGEETVSRLIAQSNSAVTMSTQGMRLAYFTARKSQTATQVRIISGATAAGATPSLVRVGIYTVAANGDITLAASTPNDTTLLASTSTVYSKSLSASLTLNKGGRYAFGLLIVTAAATPTLVGLSTTAGSSVEAGQAPKVASFIAAQADLPNSVVSGSLSDSHLTLYGVVLP